MVFGQQLEVDITLDMIKHGKEVMADLSFLVYGRVHLANHSTVPTITVVPRAEGERSDLVPAGFDSLTRSR